MERKKLTKLHVVAVVLLLAIAVSAVWLLVKSRFFSSKIRNVILISIDTCRADHLSCYGYWCKTTPNIDAVAADGILFSHAIAPVAITLPSHSSMLTGTIPPYHGVHDNLGYILDDQSNVTLTEILQQNGYTTGAIVSSFVMDSEFGLCQGFDSYNDRFVEPIPSIYKNERRGGEASRFACNWLEEHKNEPFFLFLHYYDPHQAYDPPEPFATTFRYNLYAGEIAYVDHCIGQVIKKLKDLDLYDPTLLIITSDHGEGRGEHSETTHGYFIYQSTVHVPLIIKVPAGPKGKKVNDVTGLVDIVPTVCSFLGLVPPSPIHGKDLSGFLKGQKRTEKEERYIYCESLTPTIYGCSPLFGVATDNWKYIYAPRAELYDLRKDPVETLNLADEAPKRARLLQGHLKGILEQQSRSNLTNSRLALSEESIRRLESLGYIAAGSTFEGFEFDETRKEPKDFIGLHDQVVYLNGLVRVEAHSEAESVCRQIVAEYPEYMLNSFLKGKVAAVGGDGEQAIKYYADFLSRVEDADNGGVTDQVNDYYDRQFLGRCICAAHNEMAKTFHRLGENKKAIMHYMKVLETKPVFSETYCNLGSVYLKENMLNKAIEYYAKALELEPDLLEAHQYIADALLKQGNFEKAVRHYSQALRLRPELHQVQNNLNVAKSLREQTESLQNNPNQPGLHESLGIFFHQMDNFEKAIYHWNKALELRTDWPEVFNNLAWLKAVYEDKSFHNPDEASRLARRACELTEFNQPAFLDTLSVAYAAAGKFPEAIETAEKASELAIETGQKELAKCIQEHLALYRKGQPYRER